MPDLAEVLRDRLEGSGDPYDPRAHGFNGELLDGMLKAVFTEGVLAERAVQQEAGKRAVESAHREGVELGRSRGFEEGRKQHADLVQRSMHKVVNVLADVVRQLESGQRLRNRKQLAEALSEIHDRADDVRFDNLSR
jgi:hypothetical protein